MGLARRSALPETTAVGREGDLGALAGQLDRIEHKLDWMHHAMRLANMGTNVTTPMPSCDPSGNFMIAPAWPGDLPHE